MQIKKLIPLFALAALSPAVAAPEAAPSSKLVLLSVQSRIDIDANGEVTAIHTTPELPAEIQAVIEGNLRKLRYAAPMKDGKPVAGVTYAQQATCAAPVDGKYSFAVKYLGNGPWHDTYRPPSYPHDAMIRGEGGSWNVEYEVAPDGSAHVVDVQKTSAGSRRSDGDFRQTIDRWIGGMHFQPEQVDGQPIATRMRTEVSFMVDSKPYSPAEQQKRKEENNLACKVALDASEKNPERNVALDSPFKLIVATN